MTKPTQTIFTSAVLTRRIEAVKVQRAAAETYLQTSAELLADLVQNRDRLLAEEAARAAIEAQGLPPGTAVTFEFGRAKTRCDKAGTVVAFRPKGENTAAAYRIEVGEGFDKDVYTVPATSVKVA